MDLSALLAAAEASRLAASIRESLYFFPLIEALHVLGLTMVFGTIAIIDLRLLGFASTRRAFSKVAADVLKWTWVAFALTVTTGVLMFITNAAVYSGNRFFQVKLALIALSGINMLVFELTARRSIEQWDRQAAAPRAGKMVAAVSLTVWITVIFLGRWVGFTTTRAVAPAAPDIDIESLLPK